MSEKMPEEQDVDGEDYEFEPEQGEDDLDEDGS